MKCSFWSIYLLSLKCMILGICRWILLLLDEENVLFLVKGNLPSVNLIIFSPNTRRSIHVTSLATGRSAVVVAGVAEGVASVAVDPARGRLYWASPGAVTTATLAGDTVEDILTR